MRRMLMCLHLKDAFLRPPLHTFQKTAPTLPTRSAPRVFTRTAGVPRKPSGARSAAPSCVHIFHTAVAADSTLGTTNDTGGGFLQQNIAGLSAAAPLARSPSAEQPFSSSPEDKDATQKKTTVHETPVTEAKVPVPFQMTQDQQRVLDMALDGASLFIGGEAGTGKSFLLTSIASALTARGLRVAVTASTGIAALNIGGHTFHSAFGIPLPTPDDIIEGPQPRQSRDAALEEEDDQDDGLDDGATNTEDELEGVEERGHLSEEQTAAAAGVVLPHRRLQRLKFRNTATLAAVDVVVLDEVSMLHAGFLEALERALRRTGGRDARRPFGGAQIILSGDFMQLTPFASCDAIFGVSASRPARSAAERNAVLAERKVCRGVQRPPPSVSSDAPLPSSPLSSVPLDTTPCESVIDPLLPLPVQLGRRKRELWYYDKRMYDSWCFQKYLLHVQLREPLRQKDATFAAELNALRCGELPYRISRSALLNQPDESAVRLLPTKAAVKNFNDCRMLELAGETRLFRTQLTMTEATSTDDLQLRQQTERSAPQHCRATLLIHYRIHAHHRGRRALTSLKGGHVSPQEQRQVEKALARYCRLPRHAVRLRSLPVPLSYSQSLSTLCLECTARSAMMAESRRAAVKAALEALIVLQSAEGATAVTQNASLLLRRRPFSPLSLFPRELVRLECIEWSQLLRRLQPAMQKDFREVVRRDTVLQDKALKVGCRVMLLRNLSTTYVNGSLGTVTRYLPAAHGAALLPADMKATATPQLSLPSAAIVEEKGGFTLREETAVLPIVRMDSDGKEVAIPWVVLPVPVVHKDWCYVLRATCLPLTPAYAFTVHKIQGVTLSHPVLFDAAGMFPCDHLVYVAASRVRRFEQLRIVNLSPGMISVHVPSLRFTMALPSAASAQQRWEAWRNGPEKSASLFLPTHKTRSKLRGPAKKIGYLDGV